MVNVVQQGIVAAVVAVIKTILPMAVGGNGISFCPRGRFFQGWLVCGPERLWLVVCLVSWTGTAFIIKVCSLM